MDVRNPDQRSLRLAVVSETYPPEVNGVARTIGIMVEHLHARGHRIQLVRPRQGRADAPAERERLDTVLRPSLPIPRYSELRMGLPAKRTLLREWRLRPPQVVQIVTEGPLGSSALAAAKMLGIPVATEFHTNFHSYSRHYGLGLFTSLVAGYLRRLHGKADVTMVPTAELASQLEAAGYRANLRVVGRGIDTSQFGPARRSDDLRREWGVGPRNAVALYVGRLAPEKNLRLFLEAAGAMRAADAAVRAVVVGDGPEGRAMRAAHRDVVFAGMRTGADLARHYASADVFVFPSMTETFGNVTTEALASGLAVVAFDYAAARQYIRHGQSGLLAPFGDRARFVELAQDAAADPGLRARLKAGALDAARALSWEAVVDELEGVLTELAGRPAVARADARATLAMKPDATL
jgi:glycosyltransferase involved in cell wall biosynthesis